MDVPVRWRMASVFWWITMPFCHPFHGRALWRNWVQQGWCMLGWFIVVDPTFVKLVSPQNGWFIASFCFIWTYLTPQNWVFVIIFPMNSCHAISSLPIIYGWVRSIIYIYIYTLWWTNIAMEHGHRNSGFSHKKWWISIAMLVHQRVYSEFDLSIYLPIYRSIHLSIYRSI